MSMSTESKGVKMKPETLAAKVEAAMLLHYALKLASAGRNVLCIYHVGQAEQIPPPLPPGIGPKDPVLANIHIK